MIGPWRAQRYHARMTSDIRLSKICLSKLHAYMLKSENQLNENDERLRQLPVNEKMKGPLTMDEREKKEFICPH